METVKINHKGKEYDINVFRVNSDVNGNARYVVNYIDIGLETYKATALTRKAGLSIYRAKRFGGWFVFQSVNILSNLKFIIETLHQ